MAKNKNEERTKNPAAVMLGRLGGLKGGPARMAKLSKEERRELGRKAAAARWGKEKERASNLDSGKAPK